MKKVLMIAHLGLASPRIIGLAKYLHLYGWEATILTPKMSSKQKSEFIFPDIPQVRFIETENYNMRYGEELTLPISLNFFSRIINSIKYRFNRYIISKFSHYPDPQKAWMPYALKKAGRLIKEENYSVLLSSSSPVSYHILSHKLKQLYGIPWVADFRDLWTQNHNYQYSSIRKRIERNLEHRTLSNSDAMITVSPEWVKKLEKFHDSSDVYLITNGFDELSKLTNKHTSDKVIFSYTGRIYPGKQDCSKILTAISNLIEEGFLDVDNVEFNYYGPTKNIIKSSMSKYISNGSMNWVKLYDSVPRRKSYEIQRSADILVLFNWEDDKEKGVVPSKFFEYIGARRPIIATGGYGSDYVEEILMGIGIGHYCKDLDSIMNMIRYIVINYCSPKPPRIEPYGIDDYSYKTLSGKLVTVLDKFANLSSTA